MDAACNEAFVAKAGIRVCIPSSWHFEKQSEYGMIVACSNGRSRCVSSVGGFPLENLAALSIMPVGHDESSTHDRSIGEWVALHLHGSQPLLSKSMDPPRGLPEHTEMVKVVQAVLLDRTIRSSIWRIRYFFKVGRPILLVVLEFNTLDPSSDRYVGDVEEMIRSLRIAER